jgi:hypothetical protein
MGGIERNGASAVSLPGPFTMKKAFFLHNQAWTTSPGPKLISIQSGMMPDRTVSSFMSI